MWFETLTGFPEKSPQQVRENITVDGQALTSHVNGKVCPHCENVSLRVGLRAGNYRYAKSLPTSSTCTQTYRMPGRFFRSLPSSICLKWCLRVSHLSVVWAFKSMIVPRDRRVLSLLVREPFIATTSPTSMGKPANQQITKSIVLRISEPHWEIPRTVCGK